MFRLASCGAVLAVLGVWAAASQAVTIDWVTVGDLDNLDDTHGDGYGGVAEAYRIGKYEVTNAQYCEFLNAVAGLDPTGLYNENMGGGWNDIGGISRTFDADADRYTYSLRTNRADRPVNYVSWYDSLRFANWLHNGQPEGAQGPRTTEDGAYDMSLGSRVVRKPDAKVWLPSEDEWYKAAYYKGGGTNAGYWVYPTQSDTPPSAELPPGTDMVHGSANYYDGGYVDTTYYTTAVGAYSAKPSDSAYGTYDQGGNVSEWNEADIFGDGMCRCIRGGYFGVSDLFLIPSYRNPSGPGDDDEGVGFRVASIPEPSTAVLLTMGAVGLLAYASRRRRRG